jgi:hypothetical protein
MPTQVANAGPVVHLLRGAVIGLLAAAAVTAVLVTGSFALAVGSESVVRLPGLVDVSASATGRVAQTGALVVLLPLIGASLGVAIGLLGNRRG